MSVELHDQRHVYDGRSLTLLALGQQNVGILKSAMHLLRETRRNGAKTPMGDVILDEQSIADLLTAEAIIAAVNARIVTSNFKR